MKCLQKRANYLSDCISLESLIPNLDVTSSLNYSELMGVSILSVEFVSFSVIL